MGSYKPSGRPGPIHLDAWLHLCGCDVCIDKGRIQAENLLCKQFICTGFQMDAMVPKSQESYRDQHLRLHMDVQVRTRDNHVPNYQSHSH